MQPGAYLRKADRTLAAARLLLSNGAVEDACNRAYYAMFAAAHAALRASGILLPAASTKTHRGLIGAFGLHLVQTGRLPISFPTEHEQLQLHKYIRRGKIDVIHYHRIGRAAEHGAAPW